MTPLMQTTLQFVTDYLLAHDGVSPSLDEIAVAIGAKSKSSAHRQVKRLLADGLLIRITHMRGLAIAPHRCPLCHALKQQVAA